MNSTSKLFPGTVEPWNSPKTKQQLYWVLIVSVGLFLAIRGGGLIGSLIRGSAEAQAEAQPVEVAAATEAVPSVPAVEAVAETPAVPQLSREEALARLTAGDNAPPPATEVAELPVVATRQEEPNRPAATIPTEAAVAAATPQAAVVATPAATDSVEDAGNAGATVSTLAPAVEPEPQQSNESAARFFAAWTRAGQEVTVEDKPNNIAVGNVVEAEIVAETPAVPVDTVTTQPETANAPVESITPAKSTTAVADSVSDAPPVGAEANQEELTTASSADASAAGASVPAIQRALGLLFFAQGQSAPVDSAAVQESSPSTEQASIPTEDSGEAAQVEPAAADTAQPDTASEQPASQDAANDVAAAVTSTEVGAETDAAQQVVVDTSSDSGAVTKTPTLATLELVLINPRTNTGTVNYLVNGHTFAIEPGQSQRLPAGRAWRVQFHRGGSFDDVDVTLQTGSYEFRIGERGWQLTNTPANVLAE